MNQRRTGKYKNAQVVNDGNEDKPIEPRQQEIDLKLKMHRYARGNEAIAGEQTYQGSHTRQLWNHDIQHVTQAMQATPIRTRRTDSEEMNT